MSFTEAIRTVLSKYATFDGRAARPEYWWWTLFVFLVSVATSTVDQVILGFGEVQPLNLIFSLAVLVPGIAVSVRRLHDLDKSGWWLLIALIPLIGLIVLIYWFVQRGTEGPNRFGAAAGGPVDASL